MEKFMHLISLTIQIHFQYKSDFIWRNIIALLHYIYLVLCIYFKTSLIFKNLLFVFEAYHLHSKTCHLYSKLVTCNWQSLMYRKICHLYLKTCQSIFFNVLFILHNLVIGMHAILMGCFVVVCMQQTFPLNLRWIREYLIDRACT